MEKLIFSNIFASTFSFDIHNYLFCLNICSSQEASHSKIPRASEVFKQSWISKIYTRQMALINHVNTLFIIWKTFLFMNFSANFFKNCLKGVLTTSLTFPLVLHDKSNILTLKNVRSYQDIPQFSHSLRFVPYQLFAF